MKTIFSMFILLGISAGLFAQTATQVVRGKILDDVSKSPIIGASVVLVTPSGQTPVGAVTDVNGDFKISNVPIGRQTLQVSFLGYEAMTLPNIIVTAGKEVILNLALTEKINELNEVTIQYDRTKDSQVTNNELTTVSARSFNLEDTKRYAGALGDPSRMAANFAGVVSGNDSRNDIVVRGNSPAGMLWQVEGLNIPNPNHYGSISSTGGPVSMLNNNNLAKSDFLTSAFPAQYGNALSGVFDVRLRNGNDEKREFVAQVGFNGFEIGAEGPFSKNSKASYLINYRYSTLGLFSSLGLNFGSTGTPNYQDLNLKVFIPTGNKGKLTFFGIGGLSDIEILGNEVDTTSGDLYGSENENLRAKYGTGIFGASYEYNLSAKTFAKLTLGASGNRQSYSNDSISVLNREAFLSANGALYSQKYSAVLTLNHKFNAKNSLHSGLTVDVARADFFNRDVYGGGAFDSVRVDQQQTTLLTQAYSQWKHRFSSRLSATAGLHFQHYSLGNIAVLEPRLGMKYQLSTNQSFGLGYGLHSQAQNIYTSLVQTPTESGILYTNKELGFTRSHHAVVTYENNLTENVLLRVEGYYQSIFDAAVERRPTSYSALNTGADFNPSDQDSLVNNGTGRNFGLELTLERTFSKGYYFLLTTSLFDSKYKGSDQIERNSAFNTRYVFNALAGKEWKVGRSKNNVLALSLKTSTVGGRYFSPVNFDASRQKGEAVYNDNEAYSVRQTPYFRTDLKIAFRKEFRKRTLELALDLQNVTSSKNIFRQSYNRRTNRITEEYQQGFFPVPFIRYTF